MTKGKAPSEGNFYQRFFNREDPHRTLVDQIDSNKYIIGRARADAKETDFLWQIWTLEVIGTKDQITYASDGEPRFRWVDRELVTDPNLPDDGSPAGIFITSDSVDSGSPSGTTVGFLYPMAKDVGIESYVFLITDDPSNKFELDAATNNKLVLTDTALGVDGEYDVEIRVVDSQGRAYTEVVTINVATIRLTSTEILETVPLGTKVADIVAVDGEPPVTFSLVSDVDQKFQVSGGDLLTADALDFATAESHDIVLRATDNLGVDRDESFTIQVVTESIGALESVITENDNGDPALRVLVSNNDNEPVPVKVTGDGYMRCEKGVFNLLAGVPLTIMANNIAEICDATFYKDNGERLFIQYRNMVDHIIVCSAKTRVNLEYRIEGQIKCPV